MDDQKLFASMMAQMAQRPDLGFGPSQDDSNELNLDDYDDQGRKKSEKPVEPVFSFEKDVITPGSGDESPIYGAQVQLEVDGESHDIILGNRLVKLPKGLLEGTFHTGSCFRIKTMKKGEEATLKAFQTSPEAQTSPTKEEKASEDTNTTVAIAGKEQKEFLGTWRVKLIDFENVELVTPDRGIYKKVIRKFDPTQPLRDRKPEFESNAHFYIRVQLESGKTVLEDKQSYIIGEESTLPKIEKCLRSMRWKEVALFVLHPFYAYGDEGNESLGIPPKCTIHYTIELLGFDVPTSPFSCQTFAETFPEAFRRKEEGNAFFKKKLYDLATAKYTKSQLFLECVERDRLTDEQRAQIDQVKLHCSLNLAFVTLRNREFEKTLIHCKAALDIDPQNMKALYRRGLVYVYKDQWEDARADFNSILQREPNNSDTKRAVAFLDARIRQHDQKEARMFQRVFQQIEKEDKEKANEESRTAPTASQNSAEEPVEEDPSSDNSQTMSNQQGNEKKSFWKRITSWWS